ncbi:MAG: hypothetical protein LBI87_03530 [Candidatus Accumulibacter sp.]|jgi:hypothetical protein|nr:hypothetical protein [Accumulibacter sp.]
MPGIAAGHSGSVQDLIVVTALTPDSYNGTYSTPNFPFVIDQQHNFSSRAKWRHSPTNLQVLQKSQNDCENRRFRRPRISEAKYRLIVCHFALDLMATECAILRGVPVRSFNTAYLRVRSSVRPVPLPQ